MYLLDTNVFVEGHRRYYGFDLCPGFWSWLDIAADRGVVGSIAAVRDELMGGNDELAQWARDRPTFFAHPDAKALESMRSTSTWATNQSYADGAVRDYFAAADSFLVAHAHAHGDVIVSHETAGTSTRRIKIPNAASALGVQCIDPFVMLRREGASFVLGISHTGTAA